MNRRSFGLVCAAQLLTVVGTEIVSPFLPLFLSGVGVTDPASQVLWSGLAQGASLIGMLVTAPFWARLGDSSSRKWMLVRAYAGVASGLALLAVARSPEEAVFARGVQGLLGGASAAALAVASGGPEAGRRIGWVQTSGLAGAMLAPIIGGTLWSRLGPMGVFTLAAGMPLGALLLALPVAEDRSHDDEAARPRASLPSRAPTWLAAAVNGFRSIEDPLLAVLVLGIAPAGWDAALWTGAAVAAARLTSAAAMPAAGALIDRWGPERVLRPALACAAFFTALQAAAWHPIVLVLARFALGPFSAALSTALYRSASDDAGPAHRGEAIAWVSNGNLIGRSLGQAAAGGLVALFGIPGTLALAGAGLVAGIVAVPFPVGRNHA